MTEGEAASTGAKRRILGKAGLNNGKSALAKRPAQPPIRCPECTSQRVWRDGLRKTRRGDVQRWLCRSCGLRFSEFTADLKKKVNIFSQSVEQPNPGKNLLQPNVFQSEFSVEPSLKNLPLKRRENIAPHTSSKQTIAEKTIYAFTDYSRERRVSAEEGEAKNLVKVESRQKWAAGATKLSEADIKGKLVEYSWYMKKNGYPESTIASRTSIIKTLMNRRAPLWDPEAMKGFIAEQESWGPGRKINVVYAYNTFLKMEGLTWEPPRYRQPQTLPFVPLESELDKLIAATSKTVSIFLQALKETGADPGELIALRWIDINKEARSVTINHPVKRHNPRILPVSAELIARLEILSKKSERVWTCLSHTMQTNYYRQRKRITRQFANPRLDKIVFTTFRHWKATMEYHRTKDILYVMKMLGHKGLQNTLVYIDLEKAIYGVPRDDEFTVKVATTLEDACELLEAGFEYVTDMESRKLFRKRK